MGQSSQSTQSTTQSAPWAEQQPFLEQGFGGAAGALSQANSNAQSGTYGAPSQFLAGFNPSQISNFWNMINGANSSTTPGQQNAAGTGALSAAMGDITGASNGLSNFNPAATNNVAGASAAGNMYAAGANIPGQVSAAMLPAEQQLQNVTLPQMGRTAAASGNANSTAEGAREGMAQGMLGQQAEATGAQLEANYRNTGAGLYETAAQSNNANNLAALEGQGQLGNAFGQLGSGMLSSGLQNQGSLYSQAMQGGTGLQEAAQNPLSNQMQAFNFGQSSPFQALDNFWNIIGSGQWGGQSSTSGTTTYNPSMTSMIGGLMGAGGSMFGSGGMFGGGMYGGAFGPMGIFAA